MNPKLKKGDKIFLIKGKNGNQSAEGQVGTILSTSSSGVNGVAQFQNGKKLSVYGDGNADEFVLANKKDIVKHYEDKKKLLKQQIKEVDREIEFHTKYDSQEDFVAHKLEQILAKPDRNSIKKVLGELKKSDLL